MKYETDEALKEIMRRSRQIQQRREKRLAGLCAICSLFTISTLTLLISGIEGGAMPADSQEQMGSFLLSAKAGGYILTAVIAFTAGIILTMITEKYREKRKRRS